MKIAIIGATPMAKIFAEKAKSKGIETHCFAWEKGAIAKNYVDCFYPVSIFEKEQILDICRKIKIDGILATTELTISIASYIARELGLNSNSAVVSDNITNKWWVREQAKRATAICQPEYRFIAPNDMDDIDCDNLEFPIVVKPASEGGKRGVSVVRSLEEFKSAMQYAGAADRKCKGVILEEYLPGEKEYSVEGLSFQGKHQIIQITQKINSGPPHCVELGHSQPAEISKEMQNKICTAIYDLLDAVMLENGPSHTEIKIVNGKVYLIELNARPGGDHISYPLTELSTGYDYIYSIIQTAMDVEPNMYNGNHSKYAGVRFVTEQTKNLLPLFESCDNEPWLYSKHTEMYMHELTHNDGYNTNYFIYCTENYPDFLEMKEQHAN